VPYSAAVVCPIVRRWCALKCGGGVPYSAVVVVCLIWLYLVGFEHKLDMAAFSY
jgi:hypothetical protein